MCVESEKAQAQTQADPRVQVTPEQLYGIITGPAIEKARSEFVRAIVKLGAPKSLAVPLAMAIAEHESNIMEAAFNTDFGELGELLAERHPKEVKQGAFAELEAKLREVSHAAIEAAGPDAQPEDVMAEIRKGLAKEFGPELAEQFGVKVMAVAEG